MPCPPDEEMRTWEHLRADLRVFLREKRRVRRLHRLRCARTSEPDKGGWTSMSPQAMFSTAGRGLGQQHRSRDEESKRDDGLPIIASDYTFMTMDGKEDGRAKPILVIKDSRTLSVAATFVDAKGPAPYAVKFFANFLKHLGYRRAVIREAGVENVPQESPVGDHRSNGLAENAVREVRSSLEEMIGKVLREDEPVLAWLPRHAADLMRRYRKGPDGRTPEHRLCGKNWRKPAIAIGEKLYYREVGEGVRHLKEGRYTATMVRAKRSTHHGSVQSSTVLQGGEQVWFKAWFRIRPLRRLNPTVRSGTLAGP